MKCANSYNVIQQLREVLRKMRLMKSKEHVCLLLRWQGVKKWCVLFLRQEGKMDSITEWGSVLIPYN